jgi:hypothetical protein
MAKNMHYFGLVNGCFQLDGTRHRDDEMQSLRDAKAPA